MQNHFTVKATVEGFVEICKLVTDSPFPTYLNGNRSKLDLTVDCFIGNVGNWNYCSTRKYSFGLCEVNSLLNTGMWN